MLELEASPFLSAVTELRHLIVLIDTSARDRNANCPPQERGTFIGHVERLSAAISKLQARSALASAGRLHAALINDTQLTYQRLRDVLSDIESRFADHLSDIRLFVVQPGENGLLAPADALLATGERPVEGFSQAYPNAAFEIEEAAKCIAFSRHTASVFHCMRAIEHGMRAFASFLEIPDPTKAGERNWGVMLKAISDALDSNWPKSSRLPGSEGAKLESLYATLDAIKNPWRNATMHVETIYAPHEAIHIARCTSVFLLALMAHCDEEGRPPNESPAFEE